MNPADQSEFRTCLTAAYALYGKELTAPVLSMWWAALKPYDLAAVRDALSRHAVNPDNGQFLPKPADVVRLIDGGTADGALIAWAKLERAIKRVGTYRSVVFDDALIHRCVADMGGWVELGGKDVEAWDFERNRFVTLYRGYAGRRIAIEYPASLPGMVELTNAARGYRFDPPVLIGDPTRARAILEGGSTAPAITFTSAPIRAAIEKLAGEAA